MKKRIYIAFLCAVTLLLTACGTKPHSDTDLELAAGNYASRVFDTSEDSGKLTARYLYLTKDTPAKNDVITTGDSTVYTSPDGKVMLVDYLLLGSITAADGPLRVASVVSLTLAMTIVLAKLVGGLLPLLADKLGFDPAVMASPFITTIVDALSLLVYFNVARALLGL